MSFPDSSIARNEQRECDIVLWRFCEETLEIRPLLTAIREAREFLAAPFLSGMAGGLALVP